MKILLKIKEFVVGTRKNAKKCPKCGCVMRGKNHKCKSKRKNKNTITKK